MPDEVQVEVGAFDDAIRRILGAAGGAQGLVGGATAGPDATQAELEVRGIVRALVEAKEEQCHGNQERHRRRRCLDDKENAKLLQPQHPFGEYVGNKVVSQVLDIEKRQVNARQDALRAELANDRAELDARQRDLQAREACLEESEQRVAEAAARVAAERATLEAGRRELQAREELVAATERRAAEAQLALESLRQEAVETASATVAKVQEKAKEEANALVDEAAETKAQAETAARAMLAQAREAASALIATAEVDAVARAEEVAGAIRTRAEEEAAALLDMAKAEEEASRTFAEEAKHFAASAKADMAKAGEHAQALAADVEARVGREAMEKAEEAAAALMAKADEEAKARTAQAKAEATALLVDAVSEAASVCNEAKVKAVEEAKAAAEATTGALRMQAEQEARALLSKTAEEAASLITELKARAAEEARVTANEAVLALRAQAEEEAKALLAKVGEEGAALVAEARARARATTASREEPMVSRSEAAYMAARAARAAVDDKLAELDRAADRRHSAVAGLVGGAADGAWSEEAEAAAELAQRRHSCSAAMPMEALPAADATQRRFSCGDGAQGEQGFYQPVPRQRMVARKSLAFQGVGPDAHALEQGVALPHPIAEAPVVVPVEVEQANVGSGGLLRSSEGGAANGGGVAGAIARWASLPLFRRRCST